MSVLICFTFHARVTKYISQVYCLEFGYEYVYSYRFSPEYRGLSQIRSGMTTRTTGGMRLLWFEYESRNDELVRFGDVDVSLKDIDSKEVGD